MKTLVGSEALGTWLPDVTPKDVDFFSDQKVEGADCFYDPRLEAWDWLDTATLDELYTIKISHIFWELKNGSWNKHQYYLIRMQQAGARFLPDLYDILYPIWEDLHGKKRVNLNAEPEDFFNKNVARIYDHDSIHKAVAYYDRPLYTAILKDGAGVMVDRDKFLNLSATDQLRVAREEVYVTALERQVIPSGQRVNSRPAYSWALRKLITSFSKGWFALFVALNMEALRMPEVKYVQKFNENQNLLVRLEEEA